MPRWLLLMVLGIGLGCRDPYVVLVLRGVPANASTILVDITLEGVVYPQETYEIEDEETLADCQTDLALRLPHAGTVVATVTVDSPGGRRVATRTGEGTIVIDLGGASPDCVAAMPDAGADADAGAGVDAAIAPGGGCVGHVTGIAAGRNFTCAIKDGEVWCWGATDGPAVGQLGAMDDAGSVTPVRVVMIDGQPLGDIVQVTAGEAFACALDEGGAAWCWGDNAEQQLGTGEVARSSWAVQVPAVSAYRSIEAGAEQACGLDHAENVICWGKLAVSLGESSFLVDSMVEEMDVGWASNGGVCTIRTDGSLWCNDLEGAFFRPSGGEFGILEVGLEQGRRCVLETGGSPRCWNDLTSTTDSPTVPLGTIGGLTNLTAGAAHSCAMTPFQPSGLPNQLNCWGDNGSGQLGVPSGTGETTWRLSAGHYRHVAAGWSHTCVVEVDDVRCWGDNEGHQSRTRDETESEPTDRHFCP